MTSTTFIIRPALVPALAALWIATVPAVASAQSARLHRVLAPQPAAAATALGVASIAPTRCGSIGDIGTIGLERPGGDPVENSACASLRRAAAQGLARGGRIWAGSMVGALVGAAVGAAWGVKRTIADDAHPTAIAGYTVVGGFAGLGVGALVGMVLPNRSHVPGGDHRLHVEPMVHGPERGVRATLVF